MFCSCNALNIPTELALVRTKEWPAAHEVAVCSDRERSERIRLLSGDCDADGGVTIDGDELALDESHDDVTLRLTKRPFAPRTRLTACSCRDSWRYFFLAASGHTACLMAFSMRRWQMRSYCNGLTKHLLSLSFMCAT